MAETSQDTLYLYPSTWTNLTDKASNYAAGMPAYGNQVYNNWYDDPLSTGQTANQTTAWNAMMAPNQQWLQGVQGAQGTATQGVGTLGQAQGALAPWANTIKTGLGELGQADPYLSQAAGSYQQGSTYDPAQLQQYLNPYTQQAAQATVSDINRNLTENLMPDVNSTFTGAGQFGSSRNSEFASRAMRDTQEAASKALAGANYGAYQNANQTYSDWANKDLQGAAGLAGLANQQMQLGQAYGQLGQGYGDLSGSMVNVGTGQGSLAGTQGNLAGQGSSIYQQNLTNMGTAANAQQGQQQGALDRTYQDWLTRQQFPLTTLGATSGAVGSMASGVKPNISTPVAQPDDVSKIMAVINAAGQGMNDSSIQSILSYLGMSGFNTKP